MPDAAATDFVSWFKRHGTQDERVGLCDWPGMGRGAVALEDIEIDTILFSIPRSLLLNTASSRLASLLPTSEWEKLTGWLPLIVTMMWESNQQDSPWKEYFDIMPTNFESLMFWSDEELNELRGSAVLSKIGKEQAEEDFHQIVQPLVQSNPNVFSPQGDYSKTVYDRMGSLILSRSFHVEEGAEGEDDDDEEDAHGSGSEDEAETKQDASMNGGDTSMQSEGNGQSAVASHVEAEEADGSDSEDEEEDDEEDVKHVSMVPWADMLNARHGCDNARLFYEKECLNMTSTKPIAKGEQIWNVYGDPPNSDLLRRYGHVDEVNPSDIVEVTADLIADVALSPSNTSQRTARIDFLLDAELDDTYAFSRTEYEEELEQFLCCISVFSADRAAFSKMEKKGKVSKKGVMEDLNLLRLAKSILEKRLAEYPCDFDEDTKALASGDDSIPLRKRYAMIVRHGEMEILRTVIADLESKLPAPANDGDASMEMEEQPRREKVRILSKKELREEKKRQREEEGEQRGKRRK